MGPINWSDREFQKATVEVTKYCNLYHRVRKRALATIAKYKEKYKIDVPLPATPKSVRNWIKAEENITSYNSSPTPAEVSSSPTSSGSSSSPKEEKMKSNKKAAKPSPPGSDRRPTHPPVRDASLNDDERLFRRRDDHPLFIKGPKNDKRKNQFEWYSEMKALITNRTKNIRRYNTSDESLRNYPKKQDPCVFYNSKGCNKSSCKFSHVCIACYNCFEALRTHCYGPECPILTFRNRNY